MRIQESDGDIPIIEYYSKINGWTKNESIAKS